MFECRTAAPLFRRWSSPRAPLAALAILSAGVVVPAHAGEAPPRGPLLAQIRTSLPDVLQSPDLAIARSADPTGYDASEVIDGRDDTAWIGRPGEAQWRLTFLLRHTAHLGLLRVHWGQSPTNGVPTQFRWEVRRPAANETICDISSAADEKSWSLLESTDQTHPLWADPLAQPTRRSWFVDAYACGLRLVIDRTNAALPVVREVLAIESASDALVGGRAADDGAYPGFQAGAAIDGSYRTRWAGAPGKSRWTLRVDLPEPETIDRVRLILGFDATSVPRPGPGRRYAVAWAPIRYAVEVSKDGEHFAQVASEPVRPDGGALPLRRRLVTFSEPQRISALRLIMTGATGTSGLLEPDAVPVVRELAAYRADDQRPILSAPWFLSVNANPSAQSHLALGGEVANDDYHARFLKARFGALLPALKGDDRFSRFLEMHGLWLDATSESGAGEALESIEGDDPELDAQLIARSSPPPIVVLSGSNDWDYAPDSGPDSVYPTRWHWNPLGDARSGGMGKLTEAVQDRVAPFVGFCGGAQILALLEAKRSASFPAQDLRTIDRVLQRTTGHPIRGFAPSLDLDRAWPTDPDPIRTEVRFVVGDALFSDVAGPRQRSTTHALPEWHADAIRPDAFLLGGPLERFDVIATSAFCAPDVAFAAGARDGVFRHPTGTTWCATVPEAFRSRDSGWPTIGAQFHAEQRDFANAAPGDPPESVADPRLFLAAVYERMVDAYERLAP